MSTADRVEAATVFLIGEVDTVLKAAAVAKLMGFLQMAGTETSETSEVIGQEAGVASHQSIGIINRVVGDSGINDPPAVLVNVKVRDAGPVIVKVPPAPLLTSYI
jgi:hypothetical protein